MLTQKIDTKPKHTKLSYSYASSMAFYKLSYYGWFSVLLLELGGDVNNYSETEMATFVLWITIGLSATYLISGIIGDLLIGNKTTSIIGGIIMFIGSILFFFSPSISPYISIIIFLVGCGLYESNLKAIYAKLYLHDKRLLDSAFTLLYLAINLGSFIAGLAVGIIVYLYGSEFGFLAVSLSSAISVLIILLAKKPSHIAHDSIPSTKKIVNKIHLKYTCLLLALFGIYSFALKLTYVNINDLHWSIDFWFNPLNYLILQMLNIVFFMVIGIYLFIIWSKKYYNEFTRLTISTIITLLSFTLSYFLYSEGSNTTTVITIFALFAYTLARLLIEPLIDSSIAKVINHNYWGIAYGSVGLIAMGSGYLFIYMEQVSKMIIDNSIYFGLGCFLLLSIVLLFMKRKSGKHL